MFSRRPVYFLIVVFIGACTDSSTHQAAKTPATVDSLVHTPPVPIPQKKVPRGNKAAEKSYVFKQQRNPFTQGYFANPLDGDIRISGSFCELRGNHFHAGLDMRTGGVEGWSVKASAAGFIERIKVSTSGYGRVLYIRHPNGYTTVYGHLQQFKGAIANYVKERQYKQRTFEIELFPIPGELNVKQGQVIALSGNTGGSGGPHLHFEIRKPNGQSTNPLLHGLQIRDELKPEIKRISIYQRDNEILYAKGNYPFKTISKWGNEIQQQIPVKLPPGKYAFGYWAKEFFTDKKNVLGINYCWLTVDRKLVYTYQIDQFNFSQGRYINTHTDPYLKWKDKQTYVRLFKEKYNPLPYYKQTNKGNISLSAGQTVTLRLYVKDYAGMIDSVAWILQGDPNASPLSPPPTIQADQVQRVSGNATLNYYEWKIAVPSKAIYHPLDLHLSILPKKQEMLSKTLQMHYPYTPLHTYLNISYKVPEKWIKYGDKLCAFSMEGKKRYYEGGTLKGSSLHFKTRSFGRYAIAVDEVPPRLTPIKVGKSYRFKVTDDLSGVKEITASIDDKWILAEYEPKTQTIWGTIPNWIKPGEYAFKLVVSDARKNKTVFTQKIKL